MPAQKVLLFGDQTGEILPSLQDLARSATTSQSLSNLLRTCTEEIRNAINKAPVQYQQHIPQFTSVLELATSVEEAKNARQALNTALLCVAQVGHVVLYVTYVSLPGYPSITITGDPGFIEASQVHGLIRLTPATSSPTPGPSRVQMTGQPWSASARGFSLQQPSAVAIRFPRYSR